MWTFFSLALPPDNKYILWNRMKENPMSILDISKIEEQIFSDSKAVYWTPTLHNYYKFKSYPCKIWSLSKTVTKVITLLSEMGL
jgi:hypothetical protein